MSDFKIENTQDEIYDATQLYYQYMGRYRSDLDNIKSKISKKYKNGKERRAHLLKAQKPKCNGCREEVGMNFETIVDKETRSRILSMRCGSSQNPCDLKLIINVGQTVQLPSLIKKEERDLDLCKKAIIRHKNNITFGYIDEASAVSEFEKLKNDYTDISESHNLYLKHLYMLIDNEKTNSELIKSDIEFHSILDEAKLHLEKYKNGGHDKQHLYEIIELYKTGILPKIHKFVGHNGKRGLKYNSSVEFDINTSMYSLFQVKATIDEMQYNISENVEIVEKNVGSFQESESETEFQSRKKTKRGPRKQSSTRKKQIVLEEDTPTTEEKLIGDDNIDVMDVTNMSGDIDFGDSD